DEEVSLAVEELEVIAPASSPLPLDKKSTINTRLDYRHLDLRDPQRFLICDVQATLDRAIHEFLLSRRFMSIRSPRITAGGSESGAAVFEVPYFGESACLVQSVQFYAQLAMAAGFDRVFEIGPVFRAENSVTSRHATEFTVLHIEMSWLDSPEELMTLEEELVKHALTVIGEVHGAEIERHFGLTIEGFSESIPRIPVAAAMEMLSEQAERLGEARPDSISERALSKYVHENYGHDFVFLTDFPASERPFYTMLEEGGEAEEEITRSFDMVWRGVEITSGSQREHKYERLLSQIRKSIGEDEDALGGYLEKYFLDMFRYGCPPHGGFGIGIDRFLMVLLALPSIRETSYVFRGPDRFVP
ncbi:MAG TPA: amino acid--tRNA ligase-related protein, partial [Solirubrobacteraceae bacterium]|nr:amino acid--tRNA ligase-related protein [Solirubrobacteraceae bacterium]